VLKEPFRTKWNWDIVELIFICIKVYNSVISLRVNLCNPYMGLSLRVSHKKNETHVTS
jgi:hypothetical protein